MPSLGRPISTSTSTTPAPAWTRCTARLSSTSPTARGATLGEFGTVALTHGVLAVLAVSLVVRGGAVGALNFCSRDVAGFDERDHQLARLLGAHKSDRQLLVPDQRPRNDVVSGMRGSAEAPLVDQGAGRGNELYRVLGVDPAAAGDELARAYRSRLRQLHPDTSRFSGGADPADTSGGGGGHDTPGAHQHPELADVQHAYQVLRDPHRRARYDAQRGAAGAHVKSTASTDAPTTGLPPKPTPVPIRVRVRRAPATGLLLKVGPVRVELLATWSRRWGR
jgi:DnaJ-domain-containing protein 1